MAVRTQLDLPGYHPAIQNPKVIPSARSPSALQDDTLRGPESEPRCLRGLLFTLPNQVQGIWELSDTFFGKFSTRLKLP